MDTSKPQGFLFKLTLLITACLLTHSAFAVTGATALGLTAYHAYAPTVLQAQIQQSIQERKYKEALAALDEQLSKDPTNTSLLFQKAAIYADIEQYHNAMVVLKQILVLEPTNEKAANLLKIVEAKKQLEPRNELGIGQYETYVSDLDSYWSISSLHYYRLTDQGTFGARINYGHRYGQSGAQFQFEAYPKLFHDLVSLNLTYGFSNTSQQVFPKFQYVVEPYVTLPKNFEISFGQRFIRDFGVNIYDYTGSIGRYFNDCFIWFRPYHYIPSAKTYFEVGLRRYFEGPNSLGIRVGAGKYPDIGDVPPLNQIIVLLARNVGLDGQFALTKSVYLKANLGYTHQKFPTGFTRDLTDAGLEINWRS